ncbi:MAG: rod shape-determining protein MreD [Clostridia bacterium]|jgi:rod shape-determining protein MreD|nr:rod shape-determining protein MreD [Clostridia bacterium]
MIISILFFFFFLIETTININIGFIKPNLTLTLLILYSLLRGHREGTIIGLLIGFVIDVFYGAGIGINMMIYMHVGYIMGCLKKEFARESYGFITLMGLGIILFSVEKYILSYMFIDRINIWQYITNYTLMEVVLNSLLSLMIYPIIYMINENLEEKEYRKI